MDATHRPSHRRHRYRLVFALPTLLAVACPAFAQSQTFTLDGSGSWESESVATAPTGPIDEARRALAEDRPQDARRLMDAWIREHELDEHPRLPEAYLVRGDALTAIGREFNALYDYEAVIRSAPQTEWFPLAIERELDIAIAYANGMRRKVLGLRVFDPEDLLVEILIRVQERLPGSELAERASIELADYYFRKRDMGLAREAYDLYLLNFPRGQHRDIASERRILADISRFKGPRYDASGLLNAQVQIENFMSRYPARAEEAGLDEAMQVRIDESLAAQLLDTANWYLRTNDPASARYTMTRLLATHPRSVAAARAREMLEERGWLEPADEPRTDDEPEQDEQNGDEAADADG
ncbi:MAG: outer membrane protein assembly factor BamD [Planctomycetota bacterium]